MDSTKLLVTIIGALGIVFTFWFFLLKREKATKVLGSVDILVDGGYAPEVISIPKGETTKINFLRKDSNECLEEVVLPDFKISRKLPLNKQVTIEIKPQKSGEFGYSCAMGMYHGKIVVK